MASSLEYHFRFHNCWMVKCRRVLWVLGAHGHQLMSCTYSATPRSNHRNKAAGRVKLERCVKQFHYVFHMANSRHLSRLAGSTVPQMQIPNSCTSSSQNRLGWWQDGLQLWYIQPFPTTGCTNMNKIFPAEESPIIQITDLCCNQLALCPPGLSPYSPLIRETWDSFLANYPDPEW